MRFHYWTSFFFIVELHLDHFNNLIVRISKTYNCVEKSTICLWLKKKKKNILSGIILYKWKINIILSYHKQPKQCTNSIIAASADITWKQTKAVIYIPISWSLFTYINIAKCLYTFVPLFVSYFFSHFGMDIK